MMTSTTTIDSQRAATSHRRDRIFLSAVDTYENVDLNRGSFDDTSDRVRVSAAQVLQGRLAVILIFGQSNGANSGDAPYIPRRRVFNFNLFDGHCYVARDPLLGATESRGNFASRMADMLIEQGLFDTVVLAPIGVGGSRVEEWTTGGARHRRLQVVIKRATENTLTFTHVLWHQGESNAGVDANADLYISCFLNIHGALRRLGVQRHSLVMRAQKKGSYSAGRLSALELKQPGFDRTATTGSPQQAC